MATELFFVFVLGGEDPIDHVLRKVLKDGQVHHPPEETIMRIHIAEEGRHSSFARHHLRDRVPRMPRHRRMPLSVISPVVLGMMARIMLAPPGPMIRHFRDSVGGTRELCAEIGLVNAVSRKVWQVMGISAEPRR
ncbi:MAG: hypothetical protein HOW71_03470 [Nonomuraea sp.]|nr:hypothetical protein [Nonomuraea sp.]